MMVAGEPKMPEITHGLRLQLIAKRAIDIGGSLLALVLLLPFLVGVGLAIRLTSKGDAIFRQKRDGINGEPIEVYKFRSMYVDRCDRTGVAQTTRDDPRVTPIGRIIRNTSIDELPQLLNVLKGDMSLIGPRPHPIGMLAAGKPYGDVVAYYQARHRVMKPGLSGWAQANGLRGPTHDLSKARARIDHDLAYIQNFSLWLDARIVVKTLAQEFLNGSGD
jgi:lipopolysaccharide/colanic/teichoic acid biosynthesis glycosyltransferase